MLGDDAAPEGVQAGNNMLVAGQEQVAGCFRGVFCQC